MPKRKKKNRTANRVTHYLIPNPGREDGNRAERRAFQRAQGKPNVISKVLTREETHIEDQSGLIDEVTREVEETYSPPET